MFKCKTIVLLTPYVQLWFEHVRIYVDIVTDYSGFIIHSVANVVIYTSFTTYNYYSNVTGATIWYGVEHKVSRYKAVSFSQWSTTSLDVRSYLV